MGGKQREKCYENKNIVQESKTRSKKSMVSAIACAIDDWKLMMMMPPCIISTHNDMSSVPKTAHLGEK